jgi:hypothetical protein
VITATAVSFDLSSTKVNNATTTADVDIDATTAATGGHHHHT